MLLSIYSIQAAVIFAAEVGATIAIVLALITLVGTVSAQFVTWHKIRTEAKTTNAQMAQEQKRSDVEIAQSVMSQTVVVLNDRLKSEHDAAEARIANISSMHTREIDALKAEHKRDVNRLERRIDRVSAELDACKTNNQELMDELLAFKKSKEE